VSDCQILSATCLWYTKQNYTLQNSCKGLGGNLSVWYRFFCWRKCPSTSDLSVTTLCNVSYYVYTYLTHSVKQKRTNSLKTNKCTRFHGSTVVMLRMRSYDLSVYITMSVFPSVLKGRNAAGSLTPQPFMKKEVCSLKQWKTLILWQSLTTQRTWILNKYKH